MHDPVILRTTQTGTEAIARLQQLEQYCRDQKMRQTRLENILTKSFMPCLPS